VGGVSITDFDQAAQVFEDAYAPNRITPLGRDPRLELRVSTTELPRLQVGSVDIDARFELDAQAPRSCFVVLNPRRGGVTISADGVTRRACPGTLALLPPGRDLHYVEWAHDSTFTTLRIDEPVLAAHERLVGAHLDRDAPPLLLDLRTSSVLAWLMGLLSTEVRTPTGALADDAVAEQLSTLALTGLLLALAAPARPRPPSSGPGRAATVRRALEVADPLVTPLELARAAGVSLRTLQDAFHQELQTTPTAHLRRRRLEGAHAELRRLAYDATTVEAVAHRWGFTNYGRFTRSYRATYGVSPAATLRGPLTAAPAPPPARRRR
jgi:AraC-like DNA-binding protein